MERSCPWNGVGVADPGSLGAVQVTFRAERAIRGVRNQQMLAIHEWAGLWNSGERYHPGGNVSCYFFMVPASWVSPAQ
jgi:hypothetical protein